MLDLSFFSRPHICRVSGCSAAIISKIVSKTFLLIPIYDKFLEETKLSPKSLDMFVLLMNFNVS